MQKFKKGISVSVLLVLLIIGCSDDDNPVQSNPVFTMNQFPMAVGNKWVYTVVDTILQTADTVSVLAFDTTTLFNGEFANVWLITDTRYEMHIDFVSVVGDTVKFYRDRSSIPYRIYVFPIEVGQSWGFPWNIGWDNTEVTAYELVAVPFGDFNAFRIETNLTPMQLDTIEGSLVWVAPETGLVRMEYYSGFRIIESYEIWDLIDYIPAS
jgi:hypothetical protein